jgi:hypothetical protein
LDVAANPLDRPTGDLRLSVLDAGESRITHEVTSVGTNRCSPWFTMESADGVLRFTATGNGSFLIDNVRIE